MTSLSIRAIGVIIFIGLIYATFWFNSRDTNSPELIGTLKKIECYPPPVNEEHAKRNRALVNFDDYALYFVCLDESMLDKKELIGCDTTVTPPLCGNEGIITQHYSLTKDLRVINTSQYSKDIPPLTTSVMFMFSQEGFRPTKKEHEGQYQFGKGDLFFTDKFGFKGDFICESSADVLNYAMCRGVLSYNSVDIQVVVNLLGYEGEKFSEFEAKFAIQQWLRLLDDIVQPIED